MIMESKQEIFRVPDSKYESNFLQNPRLRRLIVNFYVGAEINVDDRVIYRILGVRFVKSSRRTKIRLWESIISRLK